MEKLTDEIPVAYQELFDSFDEKLLLYNALPTEKIPAQQNPTQLNPAQKNSAPLSLIEPPDNEDTYVQLIKFDGDSQPEIGFIPLTPAELGTAYLREARKTLAGERHAGQIEQQRQRAALASRLFRIRKQNQIRARKAAEFCARSELSRALIAVEVRYSQVVSQASRECLETVHKVCRLLLRREIANPPGALGAIIDHELSMLQYRRIEAIKIHPESPERERLKQTLSVPLLFSEVLESDEATIVTASGDIQISLSEELDQIIHELRSLLIQQQEGSDNAE